MLLIEQSVVREAAKIAQQLVSQCTEKSEQVEWTKAANSLRFPFWDWTLPDTGKNGIPSILMSSTTQILDPTQPNPISVPNPLYSYQLNGINKCFDNPDKYPMYLQNWPQTYRWPDDKKPISEDNLANLQSAFVNGVTIFNKPRPNYTGILQEVHNLFTLPMCETTETEYHGNMWDIFSNTGTFDPDNPDKQPSDFGKYSQGFTLESPHNTIHILTGGYGHMSMNETAAFDPIFFLHHANVDRLYAFWEYVYPDYWMDQGYTDSTGKRANFQDYQGTWDLLGGSQIDNATPLVPFRKDDGNYWTSDDARGLVIGQGCNKYYTYPAINVGALTIQVDKPCTPTQLPSYLLALQFYFGHLGYLEALEGAPPIKPGYLLAPGGPSDPQNDVELMQKYRQFSVIVTYDKFAFKLSHSIEIFLPKEDQTPGKPEQSETIVASVTCLKRSDPFRCANCVGQQQAGRLHAGHMVINPVILTYLLERHGINEANTTEDQIVNVLRGSLRSRAVDPGRRVLAEGSHDGGGYEGRRRTDPARIPTMRLVSALRKRLGDSPGGPIHSDNHADHGLLNHVWVDM